jgi:ubiquitin-conjugating enzyme E2 Z
MNQSQLPKVIKIETIKRLLKDTRQIIKHPLTDNGIYYSHDEINITKGYAMIVGPSETPYFGGYYFFEFDYPVDYPFSPPKVTYMTNDEMTRFNPNLYKSGKVCISILNTWSGDKWSSCQTINSVLLTLCSLLNNAPLENEPGQTKISRDFIHYQKSIEFKNIDFAICDLINLNNKKIPPPFEIFYPFMKQHFICNYDNLIAYVKSKPKDIYVEVVSIYNMKTNINYSNLETKLIETKQIIDSQTI